MGHTAATNTKHALDSAAFVVIPSPRHEPCADSTIRNTPMRLRNVVVQVARGVANVAASPAESPSVS